MIAWENSLVPADLTLLQAIERLNATAFQICLVVDANRKLLGTLTDGDIRRAILRSVSMDSPVTAAMNRSPHVAVLEQSLVERREKMISLRIHQLPVVNEAGQVIGLDTVDALVQRSPRQPNAVILLVGGLGSRLRPLTDDRPKPLIAVGGRPVLETILESFIVQGYWRFFLAVNYKAELIKQHFGGGERWGVEIRYLEEIEPLGTAGPLSLIQTQITEPLLVMNGDLLTKTNFVSLLEYHGQRGVVATMCVREYAYQIPFGVVSIDDTTINDVKEKPIQRFFVNAGIYAISPCVLELISKGKRLDMPDLFRLIIQRGETVAAFPLREYWRDIGCPEDLQRANLEFGDHFSS